MKDYEEIIREKGLPEVGQQVRSKKYGTIWRVMEKKEVWANISPAWSRPFICSSGGSKKVSAPAWAK